jgi:hypothetical protein
MAQATEGLGGGARSEVDVRQLRDEVVGRVQFHPEPRFLGVLAALEWALGDRESAPVTGPAGPPSSGGDLVHEEQHAHRVGEHPRLSGMAPEYADAVKRTLLWLEGKTEERPLVSED